MQTAHARLADPTKILTRRELTAVLADLRRKAPRSPNTRLNLVIFRLATCCGLRATEIARLRVGDVRVELPRPHLKIRVGEFPPLRVPGRGSDVHGRTLCRRLPGRPGLW